MFVKLRAESTVDEIKVNSLSVVWSFLYPFKQYDSVPFLSGCILYPVKQNLIAIEIGVTENNNLQG